ncbi:hypothetical protein ACGF0D_17005 [Kitasatospora sp. NPDC048298]
MKEGHSYPYVLWLINHFKETLHHALQLHLGTMDVTCKGDKTFTA